MTPTLKTLMPAACLLVAAACQTDPTTTPADEAKEVVAEMTDQDGTWSDAGQELGDVGDALTSRQATERDLSNTLDGLSDSLDAAADELDDQAQTEVGSLRRSLDAIGEDLAETGELADEEARKALADIERALKDVGAEIDALWK